jgi:hypothetical protein
MRPQNFELAASLLSRKSNKLENAIRWDLRRIKYGISSTGSARRPNRAAGLRNSIGLLEQTDGRQRGEDEIAQIAIGDIERVMNTALVAETAQFRIVMR